MCSSDLIEKAKAAVDYVKAQARAEKEADGRMKIVEIVEAAGFTHEYDDAESHTTAYVKGSGPDRQVIKITPTHVQYVSLSPRENISVPWKTFLDPNDSDRDLLKIMGMGL